MGEIKYRKPEEMKDSGVEWLGMIPKEWRILFLKRCLKVKNGKEISDDNEKSIKDVDVYGSGGVFKNTSKYLLDAKSVLFGRKGTIGKPIFVNGKFWTVDTMYYTLFEKEMESKFFYYLLSIYPWPLITTQTALPSVVGTDIENSKSAIPEVFEQQKIINFLDIKTAEFDSIISKKEKLIEKLKDAKKSLISEMVTGKVKIVDGQLVKRKSKEMKESGTIFGQIPVDWVKSRMKFHVSINARIGWKGLKASEYVEHGYFFLSTPNIKDREIDFKNVNYINKKRYDESPKIKLKVGDVLLTKDGSTLGTVNVVRRLDSEGTINSSIAILRIKDNLNPLFLYYLLMSKPMVSKINMMKDGMGVPHLFQADIKEFELAIPSKYEMNEISKYLDLKTRELEYIVDKVNCQVGKLKQAKQALIDEAVTGKIDLRDWEIIEKEETQ